MTIEFLDKTNSLGVLSIENKLQLFSEVEMRFFFLTW